MSLLPSSSSEAVGEAYRVAVQRGESPRTTIAESAGVSNEVAGRWVRQARKRGYLPATEPGKVSA
jgi:transposase